jgi:protein SCO1
MIQRSHNRRAFLRYSAVLAVIAILSCKPVPHFIASDITGSDIASKPWALYDAHGVLQTRANFKGKLLVMFFGFTHCPDVCPTTLIDYANALKELTKQGIDTTKIQIVFATLDPARDVFPDLQTFTAAFNPSFMALRGDDAATQQAAEAFKVFYAKSLDTHQASKTDSYSIDHTAASYVFDTHGNVRLFVRNGQPLADLVSDLKTLLQ